MMTLAARGLSWLLGSSKLLTIGTISTLLLLGSQLWQERDKRMKAEAAQVATAACDASWELAQEKARTKEAERQLQEHKRQLEQERLTTEDLSNERQKIRAEFAAYKAAAGTDPRCLSDGVLDLLR